jgi:hypothetical protein
VIKATIEDADVAGLAAEFEQELLPRMKAAAEAGGDILLGKIKSFLSRPGPSAPGSPPRRDTGELHDSMERYPARKVGRAIKVLVGVNHPNKRERSRIARKAAALEYGGTDKRGRVHPPYPFARPAEESTRDQVYREIDRHLSGE